MASNRQRSKLAQVLQELSAKDLALGFTYATNDELWRHAPLGAYQIENKVFNIASNDPTPPKRLEIPKSLANPQEAAKPQLKSPAPAGSAKVPSQNLPKNDILSAFSRQQELASKKSPAQVPRIANPAPRPLEDDEEDIMFVSEDEPPAIPKPRTTPVAAPLTRPSLPQRPNRRIVDEDEYIRDNNFDPPPSKRPKIDLVTPTKSAAAQPSFQDDAYGFEIGDDDLMAVDIDAIVAQRQVRTPSPVLAQKEKTPPRLPQPTFASPLPPPAFQQRVPPVAPQAAQVSVKPDPMASGSSSSSTTMTLEELESLLPDIKDELLELYEKLDDTNDEATRMEIRARVSDLRKQQKEVEAQISQLKSSAQVKPPQAQLRVTEYVPSSTGKPIQQRSSLVTIDLVEEEDYPMFEATQYDDEMVDPAPPKHYWEDSNIEWAPKLPPSLSSRSSSPPAATNKRVFSMYGDDWESRTEPTLPAVPAQGSALPRTHSAPVAAPPPAPTANTSSKANPVVVNNTPEERHYGRKAFPWSGQIDAANLTIFGHTGFRSNQLAIINAIMDSKDVFVMMPTGGGKSLCYQLPALCSEGITVVVEPLLSLIEDQVRLLRGLEIECGSLTSATSAEERAAINRQLSMSAPTMKMLYVTPEKICTSQYFQGKLANLHQRRLLARFIIDEAHCVSQWGHEFRPDYKKLGMIRLQLFPDIPIVALTATATTEVRQDILSQLGISRSCITFWSSFNRPNLYWEVRTKNKDTLQEIVSFIKENYNSPGHKSGIIYCLSKAECETVSKKLHAQGINCSHYHAGMVPEERSRVQRDWTVGKIDVICATIAFGMGINKADVRYVIHYSMPKSIEGFYQEAGRAGRDGRPSKCILYFSPVDKGRIRRITEMSNLPQRVFEIVLQRLQEVDHFCMNTGECRRSLLLGYFGERFDRKSCVSDCEGCDNCNQLETPTTDVSDIARAVVGLVRQMADNGMRSLGKVQLANILRGGNAKTIQQFERLPNFGALPTTDKDTVQTVIVQLAHEEILKEKVHTENWGVTITFLIGPKAQQVDNQNWKMELRIRKREFAKKTGKAPTSRKRKGDATADIIHEEDDEAALRVDKDHLYCQLLYLRDHLAISDNDVQRVISNDLLDVLLDNLPSNIQEMGNCEGIGPRRAQKYGQPFIDKINEVVAAHAPLRRLRQKNASLQVASNAPTPNRNSGLNLKRFSNPRSS